VTVVPNVKTRYDANPFANMWGTNHAPDAAPVAAATAPGADASRGVIKLHGRLVPMSVRYQTLAGDGFELSSEDVRVSAVPYEGTAGHGAREADARLRIGDDLDVGYGGFDECLQ
jgi:hypothetical protein